MDNSKQIDALLQIGLLASSLATANTLLLKRLDLLPDDEAREMAEIFRQMAGLFEGVGNDFAAGRLWTMARGLDGTGRKG